MIVEPFRGSPVEWDRFVRGRPDATYCHLVGWQAVIEETFGHETVYLAAASSSGELAGVLPMVWVRSRLFGRFLVSMPFLNSGGPLGTPAAIRALVREGIGRLERGNGDLLELRCRSPAEVDLPDSGRKITVLLDLPGAPEELWRALAAKVRSQVRRPQKEGMSTRFGLDELDPFYAVFSRHMRDLGTPVLPRRWFHTLASTFPSEIEFGCVYHAAGVVAAGCGFRYGGEFELVWAASLHEHNRLAPNMLLYWSFIERAVEAGDRVFNFGRCTRGSGTHRFKRQWGGRDVQLHWYQHGPGDVDKTPSPEDRRFALGPRLWRRLPVRAAESLGPKIVKYIP